MFYETIGTRRTRTHRKVVLPKDKVLKERISAMYHLTNVGVRYAQKELKSGRCEKKDTKPNKTPRRSMWPLRVRKTIAKLREAHKYWVQVCKRRRNARVNHLRSRDYVMIRLWMRQHPGTFLRVPKDPPHKLTWSDVLVTKGNWTTVVCTAQRALEESLNSSAKLTPLFIKYLYKRPRTPT